MLAISLYCLHRGHQIYTYEYYEGEPIARISLFDWRHLPDLQLESLERVYLDNRRRNKYYPIPKRPVDDRFRTIRGDVYPSYLYGLEDHRYDIRGPVVWTTSGIVPLRKFSGPYCEYVSRVPACDVVPLGYAGVGGSVVRSASNASGGGMLGDVSQRSFRLDVLFIDELGLFERKPGIYFPVCASCSE